MPVQKPPTRAQINTWRRYLANERAEAVVYRELARKREGAEREILLELAEAESRHEQYWRDKLGDYVGMPRQPDLNTRVMGFMAKHFGSVFTLALMQTAESRSPYIDDKDASPQIAADERMHAEVVRALAARGRERISGGFRAAIFGANDGLVSNVALVLGVLGSGLGSTAILLTGISGLLAGALSMAAGEYVSVKSQSELLEASTPDAAAHTLPGQVDVNANELALVYRARGMSAEDAADKAADTFARISTAPRLDAAERILAGMRVRDTPPPPTMGAIAAEVGLARSALYRFFPDVDGIIEAVVARQFPLWLGTVRDDVDSAGMAAGWPARVIAYVESNLRLAAGSDHSWRAGISALHLSAQARERIGALHRELNAILDGAIADSPVSDPVARRHLASTIQALVDAGVREVDRLSSDDGDPARDGAVADIMSWYAEASTAIVRTAETRADGR